MYFNNKKYNNISIRPLIHTDKFIKKYRIIVKYIDNSIQLLQEGEVKENNWVPTIEFNNKKLLFQINFNDENFQIKSDFELYKNKDQKLILYTENEKNKYAISDIKYGNITDNSIIIKDVFSNKILARNILNQKIFVNETEEVIHINEKTYFWTNKKYNCDAILCIALKNSLKFSEINHTIKSRKIYWKYILCFKYIQFTENVKIISENNTITFLKILGDSKNKTVTFISENKIELKEAYEDQLNLLINDAEILTSLQYPSFKNFNIFKDEYTIECYINL